MKEVKSEKIFEPDKKLSGFEKAEIVEREGKFGHLNLFIELDGGDLRMADLHLNETDIKELYSLFGEITAKYWPEKEEKKTAIRKPRANGRKKQ